MDKTIVLITNLPRPYRIPLFNEIDKQMQCQGNHFEILFYSHPQHHRRRSNDVSFMQKAVFRYQFVSGIDISLGEENTLTIPLQLPKVLRSQSPDAIITGGFGLSSLIADVYCSYYEVPLVIWSGEISQSGERSMLGAMRRKVRSKLIVDAKSYVAYGTKAKEFLLDLGAVAEKIFVGWNVVDNEHFADNNKQNLDSPKSFAWHHNLLYIGTLVPRKGVIHLLEALKYIDNRLSDCGLHLVGSGSEEESLKAKAKDLGIADKVKFHGYKSYEELPYWYQNADVFVIATNHDVWGLVINEALASGTPVVASKYAGASHDLVIDGKTGYVVDPANPEEIAKKILRILKNPSLQWRMGQKAKQIMENKFNISNSVKGFLKALKYSLNDDPRSKDPK